MVIAQQSAVEETRWQLKVRIEVVDKTRRMETRFGSGRGGRDGLF